MGFKTHDLVPLGTYGPTSTTPFGREVKVKVSQVTRTDTALTTKLVLPAHSSVMRIDLLTTVASNAGTTATVTVKVGATTVINAASVLSTGTTSSTIIQLEDVPQSGDIVVSAQYAETGTASSAGGPFYFYVYYVE